MKITVKLEDVNKGEVWNSSDEVDLPEITACAIRLFIAEKGAYSNPAGALVAAMVAGMDVLSAKYFNERVAEIR